MRQLPQALSGVTERLWLRLMRVGAMAGCHQLAERSFFLGCWQFPVCARCAGLPLGWLAAPIALWLLSPPLWLGPLCLLPMAVDWGLQRWAGRPSNNPRRFVTGVAGGFGYILFLLQIVTLIAGAL